jgi:hypothetical protein
MANVTETSTWETGVYQLETTDPVEGGALGISNTQAKQLGNRTKWLYDAITTINNWIAVTKFLFFLRKGTVAIGNVSGTTDIRTVTFASVGTSDYMVVGSLISKSTNYQTDIDVLFQIREKTSTSFKVCLREFENDNQDLDFDYVLIPF